MQQRGEQDRHLLALEEDVKKAEAKLLAAVREKTALSASVITLERQRAELKKVNEFLKNKVALCLNCCYSLACEKLYNRYMKDLIASLSRFLLMLLKRE